MAVFKNNFSQPSGIASVLNPKNEPIVLEFAFINSTKPGRHKDPEIRRFVRGHVVRDSTRKKRLEKKFKNQVDGDKRDRNIAPVNHAVVPSFDASEIPNWTMLRIPLSLPTNGLDPHPSLSRIIYHITTIGKAMYPLVHLFKFNPVSPAVWFDSALKDEALFHALLYTTSTYAGLILGSTESKESVIHVGRSLSLVKERLANFDGEGEVEGTIRAVSCLAITEALRGNVDGWKIHLKGLRHLIVLKGGFLKLSVPLQLKVYRADVMGATDYLCSPYFSQPNTLPSLESLVSLQPASLPTQLNIFLDSLPISHEIRSALKYLHTLSQTIAAIISSSRVCTATEQVALLKNTYSLRYALISHHLKTQQIDEALIIGAMLYLHSTPQEFPYSAVGPLKLIKRMKELVMGLKMGNNMEASLVLWILFMSGIVAKGGERVWFVVQVAKLTRRLGINDWEGVESMLKGLWWVGALHKKVCRELWEEVKELRNALGEEQT